MGKQFATSHLFLTQRENYIRVACSAIIILATNPVLLGNIHWVPFPHILPPAARIALYASPKEAFFSFLDSG